MSPRPDFRRYRVPCAGLFWGVCMTLAALIGRVQDWAFHPSAPLSLYFLLALPGYLVAAGWLLIRLVR
jgi:hypothetical protein